MIYEKYIRVLHIDLTAKKVRIEHREDLYGYLGGVGVASKLLEENMHPELDPLDEKQPGKQWLSRLSKNVPACAVRPAS